MNRLLSRKFVAAAAFAAAALGTASAAQAHTDVYFSLGMPAPVYVEPAPVYVEPAPVYVQPAPVYVQPAPVYVQPRPVYAQPPAYRYERGWQPSYESRFEREQEWRRAEWRRREWERRHHEWDRYRSHGREWD